MDNDLTSTADAQRLIAYLEERQIGPFEIAHSDAAREQAEAFIASFIRGVDEPSDPGRFDRIAKKVSARIVTHGKKIEGHRELLEGITEIFTAESVLPDPE